MNTYNKPFNYNKPFKKIHKTFVNKYIRIDDEKYTHDDISKMDYNGLCTLILKIENAIASCEDYQKTIQMDYPKDSEVYKQKMVNCRIAVKRLREGQLWASIARKKIKNELYNSELHGFRETARELLDKETFDKIVNRTKAKIELELEMKGDIA